MRVCATMGLLMCVWSCAVVLYDGSGVCGGIWTDGVQGAIERGKSRKCRKGFCADFGGPSKPW